MLVRYNSVFVPLCSPNTCKDVFNPNVTTFQSNCAEGLHFSAFHFLINKIAFLLKPLNFADSHYFNHALISGITVTVLSLVQNVDRGEGVIFMVGIIIGADYFNLSYIMITNC